MAWTMYSLPLPSGQKCNSVSSFEIDTVLQVVAEARNLHAPANPHEMILKELPEFGRSPIFGNLARVDCVEQWLCEGISH